MLARPKVLVISFSPIYRDSRVLREIKAVSQHADVVTVGYGKKPDFVTEHIQVQDNAPSLPQTPLGVAKLALRRLRSAELAAPASQDALKKIGSRTFDLIIANDARALPLAFAVNRGAPVWADMHEWAPEERTHVLSWRLLVAPLMDHLCATYLPKCGAVTTVGASIADLYASRYGVRPQLVRNAAPYADLTPSPLDPSGTIRLVHSGGAVPGRNLEAMIDAVIDAGERFTLDLYLVPANDGGAYHKQLVDHAARSPRITIHPPVAPGELPQTLNSYDVGIFWIPPFNTNARLTLPNKLFDFVQARLGVAVGPTIEMVQVIEEYGLGVVSDDFSHESMVATLQAMTPDAITSWKNASHKAAHELSFENEEKTISSIVTGLLETSS